MSLGFPQGLKSKPSIMARYLTPSEKRSEIIALNEKKIRILEEKMRHLFSKDIITDNMVILYNDYEREWIELNVINNNLKHK